MPIKYSRKNKVIHLYNKDISYLIHITPDKGLIHLYFGSYLKDYDLYSMAYNTSNYYSHLVNGKEEKAVIENFNSETSSMEFPCFGTGDYRPSAIKIKNRFGDETTDFRYVSHKVFKGKKKLEGLPCLYGSEEDFTTLHIYVVDKVTNVKAILEYCLASNYPIITRSVKVINESNYPITIKKLYSACLDFKTDEYEFYRLTGRYAKERNIKHNKVMQGEQSISSLEGKSSHNKSPFAALTSIGATEDYGDVYSVNFVYSGNFEIKVEVNQCLQTRLLVGINPETFEYYLESKEEFQSPEVVLQYTNKGLGEMSRIYHRLFNNHLIRGPWKDKKRPLLLNSWEGCYMNFDTEKIINFIKEASEIGVEMVVLDDGWFGKRDTDESSLGDWFVNKDKVDLHRVIDELHKRNMKFGLWFEPEMICPKSKLYEEHPDYAIASKNRNATLMRHQMMLNMARQDVCDNVFDQLSKMLDEYQIDYIKWDHNRAITEAYCEKLGYKHMGEFYHRFILGTYSVFERLNEKYPHVLIESCCAGGGRYDAGILYYTPQVWTSDETDPIERLSIQEGTSFAYPCSSMGAHVSANPRTSYETKGHIAMQGTFGYELNPTLLTAKDKEVMKKQVEEYHKYYDLTHKGDLYRLIKKADNDNRVAWMFVSSDKKEALFTYVVPLRGYSELCYIKLKGLDPNKYYYCEQLNKTYLGKFLMEFGLNLTFKWILTNQSIQLYFKEKVKD